MLFTGDRWVTNIFLPRVMVFFFHVFFNSRKCLRQALPLVSTFWGVLLFGEYRRSSKRTYTLLVSMLLMFIVAVAILMASSGHRKNE